MWALMKQNFRSLHNMQRLDRTAADFLNQMIGTRKARRDSPSGFRPSLVLKASQNCVRLSQPSELTSLSEVRWRPQLSASWGRSLLGIRDVAGRSISIPVESIRDGGELS